MMDGDNNFKGKAAEEVQEETGIIMVGVRQGQRQMRQGHRRGGNSDSSAFCRLSPLQLLAACTHTRSAHTQFTRIPPRTPELYYCPWCKRAGIRCVLVCTHKTFTNGRSIFSRSIDM